MLKTCAFFMLLVSAARAVSFAAINDLGFFVSIVSSAMHNNSQIVRLLILSNESNRCVWENGDLGHRNECVKKRVDICEVRGLFKN
jgi:uncharacterized protein YjiK